MNGDKQPTSSIRKREANRANAQRSTGPRTAEGKAAASRNARRHGLAVPVGTDSAQAERIEALAVLLVGGASSTAAFGHARVVAEDSLELARIAAVRYSIIATALRESAEWSEARRKHIEAACAEPGNGHPHPASAASSNLLAVVRKLLEQSTAPANLLSPGAPESGFSPVPEDSTEPLRDAAEELQRLYRYERRALSRRKKALRQLQWHLFAGELDEAQPLG